MYRAGWEVSKASVFANIVLAGLLLILGAVLFKELKYLVTWLFFAQ